MTPQLAAIWLEFEHFLGEAKTDYFNMQIQLQDGRKFALNVWTFAYAKRVEEEVLEETAPGKPLYCKGPDLLVRSATRPDLERIARELVQNDALEPHWLTVDTRQKKPIATRRQHFWLANGRRGCS